MSHITPDVLYPSLNFAAFDKKVEPLGDLLPKNTDVLFLSINRFERKKNLGLAVEALGELKIYNKSFESLFFDFIIIIIIIQDVFILCMM